MAIPTRQKIRNTILVFAMLTFPLYYTFFSPYFIVDGAFNGIAAGSCIMFISLLIGSVFMGRSFCGWLCPAGFLQDICLVVNKKKNKGGYRNNIKYFIWAPWIALIIYGFIHSASFKSDFFYLTPKGISIDGFASIFTYYAVAVSITLLALIFGRRNFCHSGCWIAIFIVIGYKIRQWTGLPSLQLKVANDNCTSCKLCNKKCLKSLDVNEMVLKEDMNNIECILCGECVDTCKKKTIKYSFGLLKK